MKRKKLPTKRQKIKAQALELSPFCYYCQLPLDFLTATIDHVYPLCKGGADKAGNMVLACSPCNQRKGKALIYDELLHG